MIPSNRCPDLLELSKLMLGQLAADDVATLQEHLAHCSDCVATLSDLPTDDGLLQALRAQPVAVDGEDNVLEYLIERLCTQGMPSANGHTSADAQPDRPERIGRYRIIRELGSGGMGIVYEAEDPDLERRVAVKVMKPHLAQNADARRRFLREAKATAAIQHDHIVTIHEVGEIDGVPYLAMQLLRGETLEARLHRTPALSMAAILQIGGQVAEGLAAAHHRGLIHRDIKPANLWLETNNVPTNPDAFRVKILDLGLARLVDDSVHSTQAGTIAGTPAYMAPEQASDNAVDHRCDLFALGCVLYRLCTGVLPFQGTKTLTILWALAVKDPERPNGLNAAVPARLSDLVMRLLAKQPAKRPQSAKAVAHEISTIQRGIDPTPPTYRPRPKMAIIAIALALVVVGIASPFAGTIYLLTTNQGQLIIEADDPDVEVIVKQQDQTAVIIDKKSGRTVNLRAGKYQLELGNGTDLLTLSTSDFTLERGGKAIVRVRPAPQIIAEETQFIGHREYVNSAMFCLGGKAVLSAGGGGMKDGQWFPGTDVALRLWDALTGKETHRFGNHLNTVLCQAVSADGRYALTADNGTDGDFSIRYWDLETCQELRRLRGHTGRVLSMVFTPDGRHALSAGGGKPDEKEWPIRYWDLATGNEERRFTGHTWEVKGLAISADGKVLLSGSEDQTARLWNVETGAEIRTLETKGHIHWTVALSPDGRQALTGGLDPNVRLWNTETGKLVTTLRGHTASWIGGVAFTPDGRRALSAGGEDKTIRLWDLAQGRQLCQYQGDDPAIFIGNRAVADDGRRFLAVGWHSTFRLLTLPPPHGNADEKK